MGEQIHYAIRLDRELKDRFRDQAQKENKSLNALFISLMEQYINGDLIPAEEILTNPRSKKLIKAIIKESQK